MIFCCLDSFATIGLYLQPKCPFGIHFLAEMHAYNLEGRSLELQLIPEKGFVVKTFKAEVYQYIQLIFIDY
jgi:hypothetical protein